MGLIAIDVMCQSRDCGFSTDLLVDREERNGQWECPDCGGVCERVYITPIHNLRKSYHMGRKVGDYEDLKESYRLESEAMDKPALQRKEIQKEITKLRSLKK